MQIVLGTHGGVVEDRRSDQRGANPPMPATGVKHRPTIFHARHFSQVWCACGTLITLGPRSAQSAASVAWAMHVARALKGQQRNDGKGRQ